MIAVEATYLLFNNLKTINTQSTGSDPRLKIDVGQRKQSIKLKVLCVYDYEIHRHSENGMVLVPCTPCLGRPQHK